MRICLNTGQTMFPRGHRAPYDAPNKPAADLGAPSLEGFGLFWADVCPADFCCIPQPQQYRWRNMLSGLTQRVRTGESTVISRNYCNSKHDIQSPPQGNEALPRTNSSRRIDSPGDESISSARAETTEEQEEEQSKMCHSSTASKR